MDCTHVKINSPGGNDAELFRNRKGAFSINVQGICDADLTFTNLVARWYGSAHDTRIFENSSLGMDLQIGKAPGLLLGDAGYPCLPMLMTPFANPSTPEQKKYNRAQIVTRCTIERTFGIWKRRFPCMNHLRLKMSTSLIVIVAVGVLHNIARRRNDIFLNDVYEQDEDEPNAINETDRKSTV